MEEYEASDIQIKKSRSKKHKYKYKKKNNSIFKYIQIKKEYCLMITFIFTFIFLFIYTFIIISIFNTIKNKEQVNNKKDKQIDNLLNKVQSFFNELYSMLIKNHNRNLVILNKLSYLYDELIDDGNDIEYNEKRKYEKQKEKKLINYPNKLLNIQDLHNLHLIKHDNYYINPAPYEYKEELSIDNGYRPLLNELFLIHLFWNGELSRINFIPIKSFLITQNKYKYELWLWINGKKNYKYANNLKEIKDIQSLFPNFKVKLYNVVNEIKDTIYESIDWYFVKTKSNACFSDDFRFVILYKYGGLYFDMDNLFLKDLSPLLQYEFVGQWSNHNYANTAYIKFDKGSKNINYIANKIIDKQTTLPYAIFRFEDKNLKKITLLPNYIFDANWYIVNSPFKKGQFKDFFYDKVDEDQPELTLKSFFPNSYVYHWHNCWNCAIYCDSYIGILEKEINETFINISKNKL